MIFPRCAVIAHIFSIALLSAAYGADWTADDARILGDPSFLPVAGQVSGSFSYTYSAYLYDLQTSPGGFHAAYDRSANSFLPALQFGVTDDVTVSADMGWGNDRTRETFIAQRLVFVPRAARAVGSPGFINPPGLGFHVVSFPATANFRALGADNPVFGLTWRAIDERTAPVDVDLSGSYSPDIFQSRQAALFQTGTLATGGQAGSVQLAISREMRVLTLRAFGTFSYEGRRNQAGVFETDYRSAPHPSYQAGLQSEIRLLPWLAVNAGVTAQQTVRYDRATITPQENVSNTVKPSGSISPYAGVLVPLIADRLVAEAAYQHDFINNESVAFEGGASDRYYKQESNLFTARVLFAFGGARQPMPLQAVTPPQGAVQTPAPARTYLLFFDWDRADLTERARQIVAQAAQASTRTPTRIEVNGYTDRSGSADYNQRLSVRRAHAVQAELTLDGVGRNDIVVHGYGESNPLVSTADGVREPQNRRVEIILR